MQSYQTIRNHLKIAFNVNFGKHSHIHHIDGNRKNNLITNLAMLTDNDHRFVHAFLKMENRIILLQKLKGNGLKNSATFRRFLKYFQTNRKQAAEIVFYYYFSQIDKKPKFETLISWTQKDIKRRLKYI